MTNSSRSRITRHWEVVFFKIDPGSVFAQYCLDVLDVRVESGALLR